MKKIINKDCFYTLEYIQEYVKQQNEQKPACNYELIKKKERILKRVFIVGMR